MRLELPEEIVKEWNYIFNTDIGKEGKEMFKKNSKNEDENE